MGPGVLPSKMSSLPRCPPSPGVLPPQVSFPRCPSPGVLPQVLSPGVLTTRVLPRCSPRCPRPYLMLPLKRDLSGEHGGGLLETRAPTRVLLSSNPHQLVYMLLGKSYLFFLLLPGDVCSELSGRSCTNDARRIYAITTLELGYSYPTAFPRMGFSVTFIIDTY